MEWSESNAEREVYSTKLGKKIFQSNNLIFYIKIVKKEEEKTLNKQKEGNNKDETEIHETEKRKTGGKKSMKQKAGSLK